MILNMKQEIVELGAERIVEKFALWPRRINNQQVAWLQNVKVKEVFSEVISYDLDYGSGFVTATNTWVEKEVSLI